MVQGLALHQLRTSEKQAFLGTLRRLVGKHARLPKSMIIKGKIDYSASSQFHTSGGFADIKQGKYAGGTVAVKIMRVAVTDDFVKIRKVSGFRSGGISLTFSTSNSARRLSFGILYPIQMS